MLELMVTIYQLKTKKECLEVFLQICDHFFNRWTPKHIYLRFWSIFSVLQFFNIFLWIFKARSNLILFYVKYSINRLGLFASTCTSWLLRRIAGQQNKRHSFSDFKLKSRFQGSIVRSLVKTYLMDIILGLKVTNDQVKTKKKLFWGLFPNL